MTGSIAVKAPYRQETLLVDGVEVAMKRSGKGPALLFLHGASGVLAWSPFFEKLSQKYDVWIPDHPGFGATPDQKWIRTIGDLAFFTLDLMQAAGLKDVTMVGHSLGGWLAAEIGIRDCSRIRNITFVAPAGLRIKGLATGDNFVWDPEELIRNLYFSPDVAQAVLDAMKAPELRDAIVRNQRAAAKFGWEPRWYNPQLEHWLHRIQVPTRIVWGEADRLFPVALADKWKELLPQTEVLRLNTGHVPQAEMPDDVVRAIFGLAGE